MLGDEFRHLEHIDSSFASEHRLKSGVGVDIALLLRVLEIILLDIDPECLYNFRPRHRPLPTTAASSGLTFNGLMNAELLFAIIIC